eukprot:11055581-Alexandrium_andersonii.AAC.1
MLRVSGPCAGASMSHQLPRCRGSACQCCSVALLRSHVSRASFAHRAFCNAFLEQVGDSSGRLRACVAGNGNSS